MTEEATNIRKPWALAHESRGWQLAALDAWQRECRGVVAVVTGAGKTFFAMQCMSLVRQQHGGCRFLIVVPTIALMDQWHVALTRELGVPEADITLIGGGSHDVRDAAVAIAVLDSARTIVWDLLGNGDWFLIVDECHHAASPCNRRVLEGKHIAALGLSATPERQYDTWFSDYVEPALGPVIYRYGYEQALRDGVVSKFDLWNVRIPLTPDEWSRIEKVNKAISREAARLRREGEEGSIRLQRLLLQRSRQSQSASARIPATLALVEDWSSRRGIVFHESIQAATRIARSLAERGHRARTYHSKLSGPTRYENLRLYTALQIDVLVTCRALDEGLDVPETEFGILAASTASRRQRIQRLGRVLRPAPRKDRAVVITLYALGSERAALKEEAIKLEGIASVRWFEACRL